LFTGWFDAPLASEGREEAIQAGKLLKAHGFEFDVVYTSWLSRAIETAWVSPYHKCAIKYLSQTCF
jgi:2,3-bisphosphoglycerate-dependent phosphoglycerate mutase